MITQKNENAKDKSIEFQQKFELYCSILKPIFENVNYYISKKIQTIRKFMIKQNYI